MTVVDESPAGDAETDAAAVDDAPATRRGLRVAAVVLLAVAAVASITWALRAEGRADDAENELRVRTEASLAAAAFVDALLTYDFDDLDAQRDAVAARSTDSFQAEFADAFTDQLRSAILDEEASSSAEVVDVFVAADSTDRVRAIVRARSTVRSATGAEVTIESFLAVWLEDRDGVWLVDELESLGSREVDGGDDGAGGER